MVESLMISCEDHPLSRLKRDERGEVVIPAFETDGELQPLPRWIRVGEHCLEFGVICYVARKWLGALDFTHRLSKPGTDFAFRKEVCRHYRKRPPAPFVDLDCDVNAIVVEALSCFDESPVRRRERTDFRYKALGIIRAALIWCCLGLTIHGQWAKLACGVIAEP